VDRVDLTDGSVALGPDLPVDEPDDPARSFGYEGAAIGRPLAEERSQCSTRSVSARRAAWSGASRGPYVATQLWW
jgi:hypothetical protein